MTRRLELGVVVLAVALDSVHLEDKSYAVSECIRLLTDPACLVVNGHVIEALFQHL